ncbi:MAG: rod shape-determining protein MreC [Candidatus Omnitrophica bacterium]|nr:rod shape-determining protein MreC [Candidatus Omnitrophota bacterium]MDD5662604.1 rod shape-determining protein MreC [Candidatus Omnitrophota bacterium]
MFNLKDKKLIPFLAAVLLLIFLSISIIILRIPVLAVSRQPFSLLTFLQRELGGLVFYHHNLVANERLKKENELLRYRLNALEEASRENTRLKESLSFKRKSAFRIIAARVIIRPADNWSSGLIIDKGSSQGIKKGLAVATFSGLAGRVVETTDSTAKVMLLCDPNLGISSLVQRSRQEGLVCGTLGANLIMKYLPEDADIKLGDTIVSSGLNATYPKGLLIGKVVDIGRDFSGLSRFAVVKPEVDLSNIEEVLVIIP